MLSISWVTEGLGATDTGELVASAAVHLLEFDCVTSEKHEATNLVTEHTVEEGAPLTDHSRANPRHLSIEAIVTQTPLDAPPLSGGSSQSITATTGQEPNAKANVITFSAPFDRIHDVIAAIDSLRIDAVPVTVTTKHRTYDDVLIAGVTEPREADDGDSLRFGIEMQEIRIAQTRSVDSPRPRETRGQPTTDRGGQEATDLTSRSSAARRGLDAARAARERGAGVSEQLSAFAGGALG